MPTNKDKFVVILNKGYLHPSSKWICSYGKYDDGAPVATGSSREEAIIEWLSLHGEILRKIIKRSKKAL